MMGQVRKRWMNGESDLTSRPSFHIVSRLAVVAPGWLISS